ncbi:MAG: 50S ribosomal protein L18a [Thermoplasmata archaeon HGW-Thermoplasmata-1]|nr:MAG: 50S ribosomal protein L18a [Thermoplasmata archaeon HGW-Thermoplasmata-1]
MKAYRVNGSFEMGINRHQSFSKEFISQDMNHAKEKILCLLGSKHGVARRQVTVDEVLELKPDEITDPVVKHKIIDLHM